MEIISEAFKRFPGKLAIAFNGGKDNMVLLDLISKYLVANPDQSVITINLIEEQFIELNEHFEKMVALYKLAPIKLMHLKELDGQIQKAPKWNIFQKQLLVGQNISLLTHS